MITINTYTYRFFPSQEFILPTTCLCCWSLSLRDSVLDVFGVGADSPSGAESCTLGVDASISRNSRRNAPKKGTTGHSAMAKALLKARSYSADRSAADRKSNTGSVSFSVMDNQKGLSLFDLEKENCINTFYQKSGRSGFY